MIEIGDIVSDVDYGVSGVVVGEGHIRYGKKSTPIWKLKTRFQQQGEEHFILKKYAVLKAKKPMGEGSDEQVHAVDWRSR